MYGCELWLTKDLRCTDKTSPLKSCMTMVNELYIVIIHMYYFPGHAGEGASRTMSI